MTKLHRKPIANNGASHERPSVLLVSQPFPPVRQAGSFRTLRFTKYLPAYGWSPIVLTVKSEAMDGGVDESLLKHVSSNSVVERTSVLRPYTYLSAKAKHLVRVLRNASQSSGAVSDRLFLENGNTNRTRQQEQSTWVPNWYASIRDLILRTPDSEIGWVLPAIARGLSLLRKYKATAIYTTGPPHSTHLIGVALKKISRVPLVLDFRDPWTRAPWRRDNGNLRAEALNQRIESFCVRSADMVILNTDRAKDRMKSVYNDRVRFEVITNGFDPEVLAEIESLRRPKSDRESEIIRLCHSGSIYGLRDLTPLIRAMGILNQGGTRIYLEQVGHVDRIDRVRQAIATSGLESQVCLTPHISHDQLLQKLAEVDGYVIVQPITDCQVPSKLYEMLLFRKPILGLVDAGTTAQIILDYELGNVASPTDADQIAQVIRRTFIEPTSGGVVPRWDDAMRAFDGRSLTGDLARLLNDLVSQHEQSLR